MATRFGSTAVAGSFVHVYEAVCSLTADELAAGRRWWLDAAGDVVALAVEAGPPMTFERMVYAVAATSPGIPWSATLQNIRVLLEAKRTTHTIPEGPGCGLEIPVGRRHVQKAWAILHGADVAICKGPKVEALAANLLGDLERVTVDRHMTMIATAGVSKQVKPGECIRIGKMLQTAAHAREVEPAVAMAALWLRRNTERAIAGARA